MRGRRLAALLFAGSIVAASGIALAVRAPERSRGRRADAPGLVAHPGSKLRLRDHASVRWNRAPDAAATAWARFQSDTGASDWLVSWDEATRVPSRIFGRGVPAPRALRDPSAAERHARTFLARHIDLLAPGADPADFQLVSNVLRRGMRVVGFRQTHAGMQVLGGQVSFRFKNDRLFVIGSEALPHVTLPPVARRAAPAEARASARGWVLGDAAEASAGAVTGPFVLPLVGPGGVLGYRVVNRVDVSARAPVGRFWVYTDAGSGAPVAREQRLRFADGQVRFNVPVRYPDGERQDMAARDAEFTVDGTGTVSGQQGQVSWAGSQAATLVARVLGPLVLVSNQDEGKTPASRSFDIEPGGTVVWNESADELLDAQLTGYVHARLVKDYARVFNPELAWLDERLVVNVNIAEQCNAFSDGETINFFQSSPECANTGRLADVIYHEFGHTLHAHSIVEGVGAFDGAHSEGLSDFLAATITGDPAMGRGFFLSDDPLRHIDPLDYENSWPRDVAEIHFTGLIFAGAMWDLRKLLIAQLGEEEGIALANRLFYATLERATTIPSSYVEILAEDDDDGDLTNGTPHQCDINAAFGAHGLRAVTADLDPLSAEQPGVDGFPVALRVSGFAPQCPGDGLESARIEWRLRGQSTDEAQVVELEQAEDGVWTGAIPPADDGQVVQFKILVDLFDGASLGFPINVADPDYEFYVGEIEELYCTDFETDPFAEGWTHGQSGGIAEQGDDWTWGVPMSPASSGDPRVAHSGESVLGTDLGLDETDGVYLPNVQSFAQTPLIDVGAFSDVRVQYRRWLNVEDGFFDQATIYANGRPAWANLNSDRGDQSSSQHLDGEWRFQDVPVSQFVQEGKLQVKFEIESDGGLEFGGWTIDDFCVVAAAGVICGDGAVTGLETCDEGSANDDREPDACRSNCRVASCGDGVVDSGEACDDGNTEDDEVCSADCSQGLDESADCGCEVAPRHGTPAGGGAILLALAGLVLFGPRAMRAALLRRRR